jgi:hypothetical protein
MTDPRLHSFPMKFRAGVVSAHQAQLSWSPSVLSMDGGAR